MLHVSGHSSFYQMSYEEQFILVILQVSLSENFFRDELKT